MLTLFSWGYWGWGNATPELVRAVDATERERGFKPPVFFDVRASRSVRAKGFSGDAFEQLLPKGRYHWFRQLGNERIKTHEGGIKIIDPSAAKDLLDEALKCSRENRRIIFFCACEFPMNCHRRTVARLVLAEARRVGRRIRIVEWPGGTVKQMGIDVPDNVFAAVVRGTRQSIPEDSKQLPLKAVLLPWATIVDLQCGERSFPVLSGPARFHNQWELPVLARWTNLDSYSPDSKVPWAVLRADSLKTCRNAGLSPMLSLDRNGRK